MTTNQFTPKLRREAEIEIKSALEQATWDVLKRQVVFPYQNCISCCHFKEVSEHCNNWNAKPPARVIAFGCPSYQDEAEIPY